MIDWYREAPTLETLVPSTFSSGQLGYRDFCSSWATKRHGLCLLSKLRCHQSWSNTGTNGRNICFAVPCSASHAHTSCLHTARKINRFGVSPMFMTSWLCCHPMTSETSTHRLEPIPHWSSTTHPPAVAHWKLRLAGSQVLGSTQRSGNRASQLASGQSGVGPSTQTAWWSCTTWVARKC